MCWSQFLAVVLSVPPFCYLHLWSLIWIVFFCSAAKLKVFGESFFFNNIKVLFTIKKTHKRWKNKNRKREATVSSNINKHACLEMNSGINRVERQHGKENTAVCKAFKFIIVKIKYIFAFFVFKLFIVAIVLSVVLLLMTRDHRQLTNKRNSIAKCEKSIIISSCICRD